MGLRTTAFLVALLALHASTSVLAEDPAAGSGSITVVFHGCESDEGTAIVALLDSEESYDAEDRAFRNAHVDISEGEARVTFEDVPYGTYAVKVVHDENGNGVLDTNFIGMPKESFGFSNDAMGRFGPPDFEASSFELMQPVLVVEIRAESL